tara:strand:+ start:856 stop:1071 length:216 start_codon:yes stop_codon:yes gene_type:complete
MAKEKNTYEFVHEQEIKLNEETRNIYYTKRNGYFVSDSLSSDKEQAKKLFELVVKHNGVLKTTTILETKEI